MPLPLLHRRRPAPTRDLLLAALTGVIVALGMSACMASAGTDAGPCQYYVTVTPSSPEVGDVVTLDAATSSWGSCAPQDFEWQVFDPDGLALPITDRGSGRIEVTPTKPGTHRVEVVINDYYEGLRFASTPFTVRARGASTGTLIVRLTPPTGAAWTRQEQAALVVGNTPDTSRTFTPASGILVQGSVAGPGGPIAAYVRLTELGESVPQEYWVDASGQLAATLLVGGRYDVLIVPDAPDVPPAILSGLDPVALAAPGALTLDAGLAVAGRVTAPAGGALAGARVVLRQGDLPSTVGQADAVDGSFAIRARAGDHAIEIVPPPGSALPHATLPAGSGIDLSVANSVAIDFAYAAATTHDFGARVVTDAPGGPSPVPGARVTLRSAPLAAVGTLQVTRDGSALAPVLVGGRYRATVVADASGWIPPLVVPAGDYEVTIEPGTTAAAGFGPTRIASFTVDRDRPAISLTLEPLAVISGVVVDGNGDGVPGVRVLGLTKIGLGMATEATTSDRGEFRLPAVRGAQHDLAFLPAREYALARIGAAGVTVDATEVRVQGVGPGGALVLPAALAFGGTIIYQGAPQGGVLVQLFAVGNPLAVAEAVTDLGGAFEVMVPDPGLQGR